MINIVSGLPRSGTSLMMQMLAAGGIPILSDGHRAPDENNPRGYYEWERIKQLPQDPHCIDEAEDRAVKVISQLLFALPVGRSYNAIFMERPLPEIVTSQAAMVCRLGTGGPPLDQAIMIAALHAHLNQLKFWLRGRPDIRVLCMSYHQALSDPKGMAELVQQFLQRKLKIDAMSEQVDQSLYHQRNSSLART
jgi:hypothetical protein